MAKVQIAFLYLKYIRKQCLKNNTLICGTTGQIDLNAFFTKTDGLQFRAVSRVNSPANDQLKIHLTNNIYLVFQVKSYIKMQ